VIRAKVGGGKLPQYRYLCLERSHERPLGAVHRPGAAALVRARSMSANLQLFLLCGVLPVAVAILMGAWQNRRRAKKRRDLWWSVPRRRGANCE
jgi:hypothetical protein